MSTRIVRQKLPSRSSQARLSSFFSEASLVGKEHPSLSLLGFPGRTTRAADLDYTPHVIPSRNHHTRLLFLSNLVGKASLISYEFPSRSLLGLLGGTRQVREVSFDSLLCGSFQTIFTPARTGAVLPPDAASVAEFIATAARHVETAEVELDERPTVLASGQNSNFNWFNPDVRETTQTSSILPPRQEQEPAAGTRRLYTGPAERALRLYSPDRSRSDKRGIFAVLPQLSELLQGKSSTPDWDNKADL